MMIDGSAPISERRKLVKTYKMCSLENRLWLLKYAYAGRPTPKMIKNMEFKTATDVNNKPIKIKGERRERERERERG